MVTRACDRMHELKKGARVISTTHKLAVEGFEQIDSRRLRIEKGSLQFWSYLKSK